MPETAYTALTEPPAPETAEAPDPETAEAPPSVWPSQNRELLLETARRHWQQSEETEADWRLKALIDKRFAALDGQWNETLKARRDAEGRPCLVIDRSGTYRRQVINEGRQNPPGVLIDPADDAATPETGKILRGLVRDIEQQSNADIAYATSRENAVEIGRGFVTVRPVYVDDFTFKQELRIFPIRNTLSVRLDPAHTLPDGSDANWVFISVDLAKDEYERHYGALSMEATLWSGHGDGWIGTQTVRVAEYSWREHHPMELALLDSGETVPVAQLTPEQQSRVQKTRTTRVTKVWMAKINGYQVLEQTQWLGRYLPIAQEVGEVVDIEGKVDWRGMTRRQIDPQRMVNYWVSAKTEVIALAPKAPIIAAWGQIEPFQEYWNEASSTNRMYLPYEPVVTPNGLLLPEPHRFNAEPPVLAMVQGAAEAADDIKAISGYQDQVPETGPGISGEAIRRRQQSTNTSSYHFAGNGGWMIRHLGTLLVDAIPHYYDEVQTARIVGDDDTTRQVQLNQPHTDPETGKEVMYDVRTGRYTVRVHVGPSSSMKNQDTVDRLGPIIGGSEFMQHTIGDIYLKAMDFDDSALAAERIKKMMPPQLLEGEPGAQKYAQAQEQMQMAQQAPMMAQELQKKDAQLMQMHQALQSIQQDLQQSQLALQNKERELALKQQLEEHKLALQEAEQAHEARMAELELEVQRFEAQTDRLKAEQPPSNGVSHGPKRD